MFIYYSACFLSALLIWIKSQVENIKIKILNRSVDLEYLILIICALPLLLIAGLRYETGTDYDSYKLYYELINNGVHSEHLEKSYQFLMMWFGSHGLGYNSFIFFNSVAFIIPCFLCINRDSPYPAISVILFVFLGFYFAAFNIMREMLGIAILMYSIKYIYNEKIVQFILCVLVASCFHSSCIPFVIAYFIPKLNARSIKITKNIEYVPKLKMERKKVLTSFAIIIIGFPIFNYIGRYVVSLTAYASYLDSSWDNGTVGYINILIQFSILIFASIFSDNSKEFSTYYNLQAISTLFSLLYAVPLIKRVQYVFFIPSVILIPLSLKNIKKKNERIIVEFIIIVLTALYCYVTIGAGYYGVLPYKSILFE